jgi:hypothetical protein
MTLLCTFATKLDQHRTIEMTNPLFAEVDCQSR